MRPGADRARALRGGVPVAALAPIFATPWIWFAARRAGKGAVVRTVEKATKGKWKPEKVRTKMDAAIAALDRSIENRRQYIAMAYEHKDRTKR